MRQQVTKRIMEICDGEVGFDDEVYQSEKMTSYRNYAISYQLMENKVDFINHFLFVT